MDKEKVNEVFQIAGDICYICSRIEAVTPIADNFIFDTIFYPHEPPKVKIKGEPYKLKSVTFVNGDMDLIFSDDHKIVKIPVLTAPIEMLQMVRAWLLKTVPTYTQVKEEYDKKE